MVIANAVVGPFAYYKESPVIFRIGKGVKLGRPKRINGDGIGA